MQDQFPGLALGWAVMFSALAAQAAPPPELDVAGWSDEYRKIAPESGARITGDWNTSVAPYMRRPMQLAGVDHPAASVWLRWSAKSGKTQVFLNAAFHCIDTAPRSMMVVCATDQKQKDFEREVWGPNVRATDRIKLKVMATTARSGEGSTTYHKRFRGGFAKIINGGSESQLQQSDIGLIIFEEPSSYPSDVGGRGPPIRQARSRQDAWGDDAKELGGGTPKLVGDCPVTDEVERRTCERYYLPCPHCAARQLLVWENMRNEDGRPSFVCQNPACGKDIGHEHKIWMLDQADAGNGGWLACFEHRLSDGTADPDKAHLTPPPVILPADWDRWLQVRGPDIGSDLDDRDPSFDGIWQAYSPFTTWAKIWEKFEEASASGNPEDLVVFWQQVLARPFEAAFDRPRTDDLYAQREVAAACAQHVRGRIPPWAWSVVIAADVQGDRLEWAAWAIGRHRCMARIEAGVIPIPPVDPRAWSELSNVIRREWEGDHILPMRADRIGVDSGGHHTNQVYVFCSSHAAAGCMALKGASETDHQALPLTAGKRRKAKIGRRVVADVQLYLVGTHGVKKAVYFGLSQALANCETGEHLPGSVTLEPTATDLDFAQITAEVLLPPDPAKKRKYEKWDAKGQRNEQLDMAVYAWALGWSFLPDNMTDKDWDRLIAQRRRPAAPKAELPLEGIWTGEAKANPSAGSDRGGSPASQSPPWPRGAAADPSKPNPVRTPPVSAAAAALLRLARD